jgi:hypothetical protein
MFSLNHLAIKSLLSFQTEVEEANLNKVRSKKTMKKYAERQKTKQVEPAIEEQFATGRLLGWYFSPFLLNANMYTVQFNPFLHINGFIAWATIVDLCQLIRI